MQNPLVSGLLQQACAMAGLFRLYYLWLWDPFCHGHSGWGVVLCNFGGWWAWAAKLELETVTPATFSSSEKQAQDVISNPQHYLPGVLTTLVNAGTPEGGHCFLPR
jgi:uncharacterized membrane protein